MPLLVLKVKNTSFISPLNNKKEKPLDKYTIARLHGTMFSKSAISLGKTIQESDAVSSRMFYFTVDGKKVSGLINIPQKEGTYPIIVLFRGYIDQKNYKTGDGTRNDGLAFANPSVGGDFITLAPDFFDYGQSASGSAEAFENRFQTYTTAVTLLVSLKNLNDSLCHAELDSASRAISEIPKRVRDDKECGIRADTTKVGIWGHSNGGHIALAALVITGKPYPTVLWAPVSKPFPYSILYYTDESDDGGKKLRKLLANFEKDYDTAKYSLTKYLDWITAPIQLHQGTNDGEVPQIWSDQFVKTMQERIKDIEYFTYPGEDHNFTKGDWQLAINRSISFFQKHLLNVVK